jgi:hypothetical protein
MYIRIHMWTCLDRWVWSMVGYDGHEQSRGPIPAAGGEFERLAEGLPGDDLNHAITTLAAEVDKSRRNYLRSKQ